MFKNYTRDKNEDSQIGRKEGARFNQGKIRFDLIPTSSLEWLAKVYTYGTIKYSELNWWKGFSWRKDTFGCVLRHLYKWLRGEKYDDESGIHHLAHAAWNCFALIEFEENNIGIDDRIPYCMDLLKPEEREIRIKAWRELADQGKEDEYNGLNYLS